MGRQGGIARFLGTCGDINGYADDGRAIWRVKSSLDKKKWLKLPSMAGQREAARLFSSASVIAGNLWRRLPVEMRRLADGGGFNTLVGQCRVLVDDGADSSGLVGQIGDVDGLRGLDLSADSSGPHGVKSEQLKVKSAGSGISFRLTGVRELFAQIDAAVGDRAGKRSGKYVVAAGLNPWVVKETVDWEKLGDIQEWGVKSEALKGKSDAEGGAPPTLLRTGSGKTRSELRMPRSSCGPSPGRPGRPGLVSRPPQRRVRVWVHAVELVETECRDGEKYFKLVWGQRRHHSGFVTPWVVQDADWAEDYAIVDGELQLLGPAAKGTGVYVVFTAVEVAEKRERHWVRLPWCSRMRVSEVVEVSSELEISNEKLGIAGSGDWYVVGSGQPAGCQARLVAVVSAPEDVAQWMEKETDGCWRAKWDFVGYNSSKKDPEVVIEFKSAFRGVVNRVVEIWEGMRAGP